jgi:hypothetical protein
MKNQQPQQPVSRKQQSKRYRHLERLSLTAVDTAVRYSRQMSRLSSMLGAIARDDLLPEEREALLGGLEELAQGYAWQARMDMEHLQIAQMRHTPAWKQYKHNV